MNLETVPLKYDGLSYTEIWISEAQERMVLAVPENKWDELKALCDSEDVEATVIGRFVPTGRLVLKYRGQQVGDLAMEFLHDGRPRIVRQAVYRPQPLVRQAPPRGTRLGLHRPVEGHPRFAQRGQQALDHSPVRSRGAGGQRDQAVGRRGE
ncbi:MAG: AIR synthase-related protein [Thermoguttaceae bacterium]